MYNNIFVNHNKKEYISASIKSLLLSVEKFFHMTLLEWCLKIDTAVIIIVYPNNQKETE